MSHPQTEKQRAPKAERYDADDDDEPLAQGLDDLETGPFLGDRASSQRQDAKPEYMVPSLRNIIFIFGGVMIVSWVISLFVYIGQKHGNNEETTSSAQNPSASGSFRTGGSRPVTLDEVLQGYWYASSHGISWIEGPDGEDGLLLEQGTQGKDYLIVEDVRDTETKRDDGMNIQASRTLMQGAIFDFEGRAMTPSKLWPSKDLKKVLIATDVEKNWRHSFYALYWILDVETQTVQPLDPHNVNGRVQLATWSPQSNAVVFTRDNNLFLRKLDSEEVVAITHDGGENFFYGIPDWVYEEEVFGGNSATWWSEDGNYIAFLRTNETLVNEFPVTYFMQRPSGTDPEPGLEAYPEILSIKYPKAGSPNPFVNLLFYDATKNDVFAVTIDGDFPEDDKLITEVVWAGDQLLVKESNRVSDILRVILIDVPDRAGKNVRELDVEEIDGGWFEISQMTRYIPSDPENGRPAAGYIDNVIYENNVHLAYFSPLDATEPIMLTSGDWEVVGGSSAVDLKNNLIYFVSTKESPLQRHVYSVYLNGTGLTPFTDTNEEAYYSISFSSGAGYALLSYSGPSIPWQKIVSTPSNPDTYTRTIEENTELETRVRSHALPTVEYGQIEVDGFKLNYMERRPPHFDPTKKYPVLFYQYSGPGSQQVNKRFRVDFQSYVASSLGYLVVTVDGRGTGFMGRDHRVVVRKELGKWEAYDQVAAGKHWAGLDYVDADRLCIWGWSFGGFNTLKTLELDAGETFRYGMAVAPVTDWRFYDSIYTERYMLTPQQNSNGYDNTAVNNATALGANERFLVMHGTGDDNVHFQNTLELLDKLDLAGVSNYDVHVFPDSDHSISFHGAYPIVYGKLSNWLINAFNGEWIKVNDAEPIQERSVDKMSGKDKIRAALAECENCHMN